MEARFAVLADGAAEVFETGAEPLAEMEAGAIRADSASLDFSLEGSTVSIFCSASSAARASFLSAQARTMRAPKTSASISSSSNISGGSS